ncbi:MAG: ParB/RepB/Spo0J family partition protein [Patescibacteria group bacterium]
MAKGLGKGIDAILPSGVDVASVMGQNTSKDVLISDIRPNPKQPRRDIDKSALAELTHSIKVHGVLQPLIVVKDGGAYTIIAGERRWRAAKQAELRSVPCIIRTTDDLGQLQLAITENIQRSDLSPLEQAYAIHRLRQDFNQSLDDIAQSLGKATSTVANIARLLQLPEYIRESLASGEISEGHARTLLGLIKFPEHQERLFKAIVGSGWSVRRAEEYVRTVKNGGSKDAEKSETRVSKLVDNTWTKSLSKRLDTQVRLRPMSKGGYVMLKYKDDKDLERIEEIIG